MTSLPSFPLSPLFAAFLLCGVLSSPASAQAGDASTRAEAAAPSLLLAQTYTDAHDPAHYLVSEKLDGVRAYWDGAQLKFRSGRVIHAPAWFTEGFPSHPLDGELWMGRRSFDRLSAAVRREDPVDAEWKRITYQLYELPGGAGSFDERIVSLRKSVERAGVPWLGVLPQERIADRVALKAKLAQVIAEGGEGLMLHRIDAAWQAGRSDVLLKLKPQQDAEARVVAYEKGKRKYQGMVGALIVVTPEGRRFRLGSGLSDDLRRNPPAIGSSVTYRYRDLTSTGLPRFASFWRMRPEE